MSPGDVLGHYEIVRLLGRGGMGEVWEAIDRKLDRRVALKVLPEELLANEERKARFEREAKTLASIQHPNIVTIHAIEEIDGKELLVMELVDGKPLSAIIPANGMDLGDFLEIGAQIADAVGAAHLRGITHRDLKPGNVIVGDDGRVRVLDFGLAKWIEEASWEGETIQAEGVAKDSITGEGQIVGTVAYMSPEQAEGKVIDHRSDVFSLGVMLYEMATGKRPFAGDSGMSLISSILRDDPDSVSDLRPAYPRQVARAIRRCLQKDPSRRYQTVLDLRNELIEIREDLDSGVLEAAPRSSSVRRPFWVTGVLLGGLALAAGLFAWWLATREPGDSRPDQRVTILTTRGSPREAALSADGRYAAYIVDDGDFKTIRLLQPATDADVEFYRASHTREWLEDLQFDREGNYIYFSVSESVGARTLKRRPVLGGPASDVVSAIINFAMISPSGEFVAYLEGVDDNSPWNHLKVVSVRDGSVRMEKILKGAEFWDAAWSADGSALIVETGATEPGERSRASLHRLEMDGSMSDILIEGAFNGFSGICPLPGGDLIFTASSEDLSSRIFKLEDGSTEPVPLSFDGSLYFGCSVGGDQLLALRDDYRSSLFLLDVESGEVTTARTATGKRNGVRGVAWLTDDTIVYTTKTPQGMQLLRLNIGDPSSSVQLTEGGANYPHTTNGFVTFEGGWGTEAGSGIHYLDQSGTIRRISPMGRIVDAPALLTRDERFAIYLELLEEGMALIRRDLSTGEIVRVSDEFAHAPAPSPDGTSFSVHSRTEGGGWKTAILPIDLGDPIAIIDDHSVSITPFLDDETLVTMNRAEDQADELYSIDIESGERALLHRFRPDGLSTWGLSVSPDGKRIAVVRGERDSELVLIENF